MSDYQKPNLPYPDQQPLQKPDNSSKTIIIIVCVVVGLMFSVIACGGFLVFSTVVGPAIQEGRKAAQSVASKDRLKIIGIGLHKHHDSHGNFPPAFSRSKDGKPAVSWRAKTLPYAGGSSEISDQIDFAQPWNASPNKQYADMEISQFSLAGFSSTKTDTVYVAIVDPKSIFPPDAKEGLSFRDCIDGTSNTICVIEVRNSGINWLEPRDFTIDQAVDYIVNSEEQVNVLFLDGSVKG